MPRLAEVSERRCFRILWSLFTDLHTSRSQFLPFPFIAMLLAVLLLLHILCLNIEIRSRLEILLSCSRSRNENELFLCTCRSFEIESEVLVERLRKLDEIIGRHDNWLPASCNAFHFNLSYHSRLVFIIYFSLSLHVSATKSDWNRAA